jgi:hypothetical protein
MKTQIYAAIIMLLALSVLTMFPRVKKWNSWETLVMFSAGFAAFLMRTALIQQIGTNLVIRNTSVLSAVAYFVYTIFAVIAILNRESRGKQITKIHFKWWIVGGYFLFGLVQQVFFKFVVFDTLYALLGDGFPMREAATVLFSALYYSLVHTSGMHIKDMALRTFYLDIGWGLLYMVFGNLHWNIISHAIIGGALFSFVYEDAKDNLGERFGSMQHVMEDVIEVRFTTKIHELRENLFRRIG